MKYGHLIILFVLAFAAFSAPSVIRWSTGNPTYIGVPTYMHERISQYILDGTFNGTDPLSFGGRPYTYQPLFSYGMAAVGLFVGLKAASVIYVSFFGAISVVFFYLFVRRYADRLLALVASLLLILIPGQIFLNSHISTRAPGVALGLAALYLFTSKTGNKNLISGLLLGVSFLFHFEPAVVFLGILLLYSLVHKHDLKNFAVVALISVAIFLVWFIPFYMKFGIPEYNLLHQAYRDTRYSLESPTLANFFQEFEPGRYLDFFVVALAALGFYLTRDNFIRYTMIFILILSLAFERFMLYLPFAVALCMLFGLRRIFSKKYALLLAVMIIYMAFFGAREILFMANDYPIVQQYEAYTWLKDNTPPNATVLSDWQWGHWIEGLADRKTFMDGYAEYAPDVNNRFLELQKFFKDCTVPEGYGISYVYIEDWFVERNNITCLSKWTPLFDKNGIKIYKAA